MPKNIYGIIGHPVKHSLSPTMHNAAFKELGIDGEYRLFDIEPKDLESFLERLVSYKISGVNITIPHKIEAKHYIEAKGVLDVNAARLGAVNTIKAADGKLYGYNTDGPGFYRSLVEDLGFSPENKTVSVLGAGGVAMAIIMYLGNGPKRIFVYDIDKKKTDYLKSHYAKYYDSRKLVAPPKRNLKGALGDSELLINATPIGMKNEDPPPIDTDLLHQGLYVYDLVYNQISTALVKEANKKKLRAMTGLGMLLYQGVEAFELWTGLKAPVAVMRNALEEATSEGSV